MNLSTLEKKCHKCSVQKDPSQFSKCLSNRDGLHIWCKNCDNTRALIWYNSHKEIVKERSKQYQKRNPEKFKEYNFKSKLKTQYGVTVEWYSRQTIIQNNKCAVCGVFSKRLNVDHNHTTGKVRELLCKNCNFAIGFIYDSSTTAKQIANYLEKHGT